MKFEEFGNYLFVYIEDSDWKTKGKIALETLKSIPGKQYYPADKSWKILKSYKYMLAEFLPPFTAQEELEGEEALKDLFARLDDKPYSL